MILVNKAVFTSVPQENLGMVLELQPGGFSDVCYEADPHQPSLISLGH